MTAKPSTAPFHWATGSPAHRSPNPIPTPRQDEGLQNGDPADPLAFNSLLGNVTDWTVYLGQFSVSTGVEYRAAYQVWDSVGGASLGHLTSVTGDILLAANDGVILQAGGTGTPTIYLDHVNDTVRLQSFGADGAVLLRAGWALNDQSFRVGFGDTAGDGTGYPTYTWDLSPSSGGWFAFDSVATASVVLWVPHAGGSGDDTASLVNHTGGAAQMYARCRMPRPVAVSEDGVIYRETITGMTVVFAAEAAATQPTVTLYRELKDGSATKTAVATCTCPASATRQTTTAPSITNGDLDWATYRYFLEWDSLAGVADGAASRGVEQVLVSVRTRAGV